MIKLCHAATALAILIAVTGDSLAQSSPSNPNSGIQPQSQAAPDTRGTEENPIVVRSVHTQREAAEDVAYREQQSASEWWNKIFAGGAFVAAFFQAVIFI